VGRVTHLLEALSPDIVILGGKINAQEVIFREIRVLRRVFPIDGVHQIV
jgi:hypothetical protein